MSDRTSALLFATIFETLASDEPLDRRALARRFWEMSRGDYDFSPYQMYCDDALVKLGLARYEGDRIVYGPDGGRGE